MIRIVFIVFLTAAVNPALAQNYGIVQNGQHPESSRRIDFSPELQLALGNGTDEQTTFSRPEDVALDDAGNIFVMDSKDKTIKKFDAEGNYLLQFGGKGQGPGEFISPRAMFCRNDTVYVLDGSNKTISFFTNDGNFISSFRTNGFQSADLVVAGDGTIHVLAYSTENKIYVFNRIGDFLYAYGTLKSGKNDFETYVLNGGRLAIDHDDNVYCSLIQPYRIEKYSSKGELLSIITREVDFPIVKPDLTVTRDEHYTTVRNNMYTRISRDLYVQGRYIFHVITNGRGLLPVGRQIDVFTLEGIFAGVISFDHACETVHVSPGGVLYTTTKTNPMTILNRPEADSGNDVPLVLVYSLKQE